MRAAFPIFVSHTFKNFSFMSLFLEEEYESSQNMCFLSFETAIIVN